ncbi:hypothetical protein [Leptospira interrogans]|uniref:hypothetical protein n=1 Tax=Leptospira interrogans TaxID=173 RepID=UPI003C12FDC8
MASKLYSESNDLQIFVTVVVLNAYRHQSYIQRYQFLFYCHLSIRAQRLTASKLYSGYTLRAVKIRIPGAQRLTASTLYSGFPKRIHIQFWVLNAYRHQSYIQKYPNDKKHGQIRAQRLSASKLYSETHCPAKPLLQKSAQHLTASRFL